MIWNILLDALFPKFCVLCSDEGSHLCEDCLSTISINSWLYPPNQSSCLAGLLCASPYQNRTMERVVSCYLNPPYLKDLALQFAFCIVSHMAQLHNETDFGNFAVLPVPEPKEETRLRGYSPSSELAKTLASSLGLEEAKDVAGRNILLVDVLYTDGASMELKAQELKRAGAQDVWGAVVARH